MKKPFFCKKESLFSHVSKQWIQAQLFYLTSPLPKNCLPACPPVHLSCVCVCVYVYVVCVMLVHISFVCACCICDAYACMYMNVSVHVS